MWEFSGARRLGRLVESSGPIERGCQAVMNESNKEDFLERVWGSLTDSTAAVSASIGNVLRKVFPSQNQRFLESIKPLVGRVSALEPQVRDLPAEEFPKRTQQLKDRVKQGESLDDILPEGFALVREAARRSPGVRHFDVQILG